MSEQWWWKADPPPNGNKGNPWVVRDGNGNVQAIISHTVPGIDEKTAKYIAGLGTSCVGHERRADSAEASLSAAQETIRTLRAALVDIKAASDHLYEPTDTSLYRLPDGRHPWVGPLSIINRVAHAALDAIAAHQAPGAGEATTQAVDLTYDEEIAAVRAAQLAASVDVER